MFTNATSVACCYLQRAPLRSVIKNYNKVMECTNEYNPAKEIIVYMESTPLSEWEGDETTVFNNFKVMFTFMKQMNM